MVTKAAPLPTSYPALLKIKSQFLLRRVQKETSYPFLERIGSFFYTVAWESAAALSGGLSHLYMAALQKCSWTRAKTPSLEDRNLVELNENTLNVALAANLISEAELTEDLAHNLIYALNTANQLASTTGMQQVQFYIDFYSSRIRYVKMDPRIAILTLRNIQYRDSDEIDYLIARKLAHHKIGYGLRKPLYHSLYHWGMVAIHAAIITCTVRRMISLRTALFLTPVVNFVSRQWSNYFLREKIRKSDQIAMEYLQTHVGMVTYFHSKVCRNYSIRHCSFDNYQNIYSNANQERYLKRKSRLNPYGNEKRYPAKDSDMERLALALDFKS